MCGVDCFCKIVIYQALDVIFELGSSQSRADLLTLGLAVTNVLAGLVWLTIRPKSISAVRILLILSPLPYLLHASVRAISIDASSFLSADWRI